MPSTPRPDGVLFYSVREWEGEYVSRDKPGGGVETTVVRSGLWRIGADGTERRRVPTPGTRAEHPQASPAGRWIYWQTETAGRWRICRARPDGAELSVIAPGPGWATAWTNAYGLQFSRDGSHLTCAVSGGHTSRVVLVQADGTGARMIAPQFGHAYMAAPDARAERVVFARPAQGYRLAIADVASGVTRVLTPEHTDCYAPQFTPDGESVIFIRRDGGLYRIASDGAGLRRLADGVQVEFFLSAADKHGSTDFPAIAPDGRSVAFSRKDAAGGVQIAVAEFGDVAVRQVTRLASVCARPAWSPDGRWLAFVSMVEARLQLFVAPADGTEAPRQLTQEKGAVYALSWAPAAQG